jgi:site-specific recombinase XerD
MEREASIVGFRKYVERRSPGRRTAIDYVSDVRQFAAACDKPWHEVTVTDIDQFVDQQRQAGRGDATVRRRVAALKVFFDYLAEEDQALYQTNPVRHKRHAGKAKQQLPRDLRDGEVQTAWAIIKSPRDQALFVLMLRGGLRVGEVVDLKIADLLGSPLEQNSMQVRVCGKGRKERMIPLTLDAYTVVLQWLAVRPVSAEPYVFLNHRGKQLQENGIQWLLRRYGERVGIRLKPHQLRHTYARQLTEAGVDVTRVGKLLGHAQIATTMIYTAGADPKLCAAYQEAMEHITAPSAPPALPATPPEPVAFAPPAPPTEPVASSTLPAAPVELAAQIGPTEDDLAALPDLTAWQPDLPAGVRQPSLDYLLRLSATWKPSHRHRSMVSELGQLRTYWCWQQAYRPISHVADLKIEDLRAFQSAQLARGLGARAINRTLSLIPNILRQQEEQGVPLAINLSRYHALKCPDSLPRHLSMAEAQTLDRALLARLDSPDPVTRLENACFCVLAYCGLRSWECIDLTMADVDLAAGRMVVRQSKGRADRVVYLTPLTCQAISAYLGTTLPPPSARLFHLPRHRLISSGWLRHHIPTWAESAGVNGVSCHRLRHTLATRLLNANMDITRIQKLLGHRHLNTTMIYARVLDTTLEADYRRAMLLIERAALTLSTSPLPAVTSSFITEDIPLDNSI